jgi:hypothetical protein
LRANELRIQFTGPLWAHPTAGVLGVRAGELSLRSVYQLGALFIFRAKNGPRPTWAYGSILNVISLETHEIVGRSPADLPSCLVISPTTALFMRRNYTIPPGIAGPKLRTIFFWKRPVFQIFSEDANALQAALGVFWASRGAG